MADDWNGVAGNATGTNPGPEAAGSDIFHAKEPCTAECRLCGWHYPFSQLAYDLGFAAGQAASNARAERLAVAARELLEADAFLALRDRHYTADEIQRPITARHRLRAALAGDAPGRREEG